MLPQQLHVPKPKRRRKVYREQLMGGRGSLVSLLQRVLSPEHFSTTHSQSWNQVEEEWVKMGGRGCMCVHMCIGMKYAEKNW